MKQARIYMKRWLGINERSKQLSTDTWYLNFANQLLSLIDESPLYSKKFEAEKVCIECPFRLSQDFGGGCTDGGV